MAVPMTMLGMMGWLLIASVAGLPVVMAAIVAGNKARLHLIIHECSRPSGRK